MKTKPHRGTIPNRATGTPENRIGAASSSPKLRGALPSRGPRGALRIGCATVLLLLLSVSVFAQPPLPVLPSQSFGFPPNFATGSGSMPINYTTDLISEPVDAAPYYGNALILDATNLAPASLNYNVQDTSPTTTRNINYSQGTVLFYFAPNWASVSQGGTGPGDTAYFLAGGDWTTNSPDGLFAIYADAGGSNIYFGGVGAGDAEIYASAPISWTSNTFHQIAVEWTTGDCEIYLDGALAATGDGVIYVPKRSTWTNGFFIGSDNNGFEQSRGATYAMLTWGVEEAGVYTNDWPSVSDALASWQSGLGGGGFGGMMGMGMGTGGLGLLNLTNSCGCISNTTVYLTNIAAALTNGAGVTFTFTIEGGTNGINYDLFATTNLVGDPATNSVWTWLGRGTNCGTYQAVNQATSASFYVLGGPQTSDSSGWTTAFEALIPNWNHADPNIPGTNVLTVTIVSPAQGAIIQ